MSEYLKWLAAICIALALFGVAIMLVGYKPISIGRSMTIVLLIAGAAASLIVRKRKIKQQ